MTFKQANDFIAKWRPILCSEWTIAVRRGWDPDIARNDAGASITPENDQLRAKLYLGEILNDDVDEQTQKRVLLHELLHLTLNDLERAALEPTQLLAYQEQKFAGNVVDWQLERAVDRLSEAFAEFA